MTEEKFKEGMDINEANAILSMYQLQLAVNEEGEWFIASTIKAEDWSDVLWAGLYVQGNAEEVCEFILNNLDVYKRS